MVPVEVGMNKVEKKSYPGWDKFPVYCCKTTNDWKEVSSWMYENNCDPFLLSSGSTGYVFQVRENYAWFVLRWS